MAVSLASFWWEQCSSILLSGWKKNQKTFVISVYSERDFFAFKILNCAMQFKVTETVEGNKEKIFKSLHSCYLG